MEKSDRPVNASWFGEGEIVDADLLVDLLETYRFGKDNLPAGKLRFKAAATAPAPEIITEIEDDNDDDGSQVGNKSVLANTLSVSSSSDPMIIVKTTNVCETDSNEETGYNWLESSSTNLVNVENGEIEERGEHVENGEIEEDEEQQKQKEKNEEEEDEEEEQKQKEEDEEEEYVEEQKHEEDSEKSLSESEEKSNLEELLATQENYELYCPSCSSCITRRVILKKRKRGKHVDLSADLKPGVSVVDESDEPSDIEEMEPPVKVHVLPETHIEDDGQEDNDEGFIFTCLSCLKYFIRLGARFLQLDYLRGKPVEEPEVVSEEELDDEEATSELDEALLSAAIEIEQLDPMAENIPMNSTQQKQSKPPDVSSEYEPVGVSVETMERTETTPSPPQNQLNRERFAVELLKSTVYGGLTETITSLGVVSSASASGSSTMNILALAVANLAGGLIVLAQNLQDLSNNSDRYDELLGKRRNFRYHILVAVLAYIFFGLTPPLVYAFSFYETGIKNYKLASVFMVSLVCVILLGMIKVYVRKPVNSSKSLKPYLKSAVYYTSIIVASSGISYVVGDIMGDYIEKLGWFSLNQDNFTSAFDVINYKEYRFTSF